MAAGFGRARARATLRGGMKAPRYAQWWVVSALTLGLALGPSAAAQARASAPEGSAPEGSAPKTSAPKGSAPKGGAPEGEAVDRQLHEAGGGRRGGAERPRDVVGPRDGEGGGPVVEIGDLGAG